MSDKLEEKGITLASKTLITMFRSIVIGGVILGMWIAKTEHTITTLKDSDLLNKSKIEMIDKLLHKNDLDHQRLGSKLDRLIELIELKHKGD